MLSVPSDAFIITRLLNTILIPKYMMIMLCCNVIDGNDDEMEACGKKSVANILLGSKPRG
jgi:hypothetical protein